MVDHTFDEVLKAALQLSPEEQKELVRRLEQHQPATLAGTFAREGAADIDADEVEAYLHDLNTMWERPGDD